jgi:4-hydroxy 2-oxovalerate aldolase
VNELLTIARRPRFWPEARLIDVTLRDGGFRTGFDWTEDEIVDHARSVLEAGCDFVELGYLGGVPELHGVTGLGAAANLTPAAVARLAARIGTGALCAMVHPSASNDAPALEEARAAGLSMIRIVYHASWKERFGAIADRARTAGLITAGNIALASRNQASAIEQMARTVAPRVDVLYFADTCGALLPDEVRALVQAALAQGVADVGFHGHDYLSMALANAHAASLAGARWIDASVQGIGRGAGNLRLELWLALCQAHGRAKGAGLAGLVPSLAAVERRLGAPLMPDLASLVSGALNLTPPQEDALRAAAAPGAALSVQEVALGLLAAAADGQPIAHALDACAAKAAP